MSSKGKTPMEQPERRVSVGFRWPPDLIERVKVVAKEDRRTATSWVEKVIADALDAAEKKRRN